MKIKFQVALQCPRHPRYSPGGCKSCTQIFSLYTAVKAGLDALAAKFMHDATALDFVAHVSSVVR